MKVGRLEHSLRSVWKSLQGMMLILKGNFFFTRQICFHSCNHLVSQNQNRLRNTKFPRPPITSTEFGMITAIMGYAYFRSCTIHVPLKLVTNYYCIKCRGSHNHIWSGKVIQIKAFIFNPQKVVLRKSYHILSTNVLGKLHVRGRKGWATSLYTSIW